MKVRFSGVNINNEKLEVVFDTKGDKFIEIVPQKDYMRKYLNVNLQGESIWIMENTLKLEVID